MGFGLIYIIISWSVIGYLSICFVDHWRSMRGLGGSLKFKKPDVTIVRREKSGRTTVSFGIDEFYGFYVVLTLSFMVSREGIC